METTPVRKRGMKRDNGQIYGDDDFEGPETPVGKVIHNSDESDSPGFSSELFRNETFSPPIVTWDTIRPKASPGTTAAARRISREIKQHVQARKIRSRILKFNERNSASSNPDIGFQEQSVEKYKQNVAEIHSRIKSIFGELTTAGKEYPEEKEKSEVHRKLKSVFGDSPINRKNIHEGRMKRKGCCSMSLQMEKDDFSNIQAKHTYKIPIHSGGTIAPEERTNGLFVIQVKDTSSSKENDENSQNSFKKFKFLSENDDGAEETQSEPFEHFFTTDDDELFKELNF